MADSSYYLREYKSWKKKSEEYTKQIRQLQTVGKAISNGLDDEIRNVNKKIGTLTDDLENAVKHDDAFNRETARIAGEVEPAVWNDKHLRQAQSDVDDAIRILSRKKSEADRKAEEAKRKYEEEKRKERDNKR